MKFLKFLYICLKFHAKAFNLVSVEKNGKREVHHVIESKFRFNPTINIMTVNIIYEFTIDCLVLY